MIISNSEDHIAACNRVGELMDKEDLTEEESLEMDVLADHIIKYEEYWYPTKEDWCPSRIFPECDY